LVADLGAKAVVADLPGELDTVSKYNNLQQKHPEVPAGQPKP